MESINYEAVLFDLDGTLLDTIEDLTDSMNFALARLGFSALTIEQCKLHVGEGRDVFARRALPEGARDDKTVSRCIEMMTEHYADNWANKTKPYGGVESLLSELASRGLRMVVLSNKYDSSVRQAVSHFFAAGTFEIVRGAVENVPRKPDPTSALQIADELGVEPGRFLYLGDTNTDMQTAVSAGMYPVGVKWGFRTAEELAENGARQLLDRPEGLLQLL